MRIKPAIRFFSLLALLFLSWQSVHANVSPYKKILWSQWVIFSPLSNKHISHQAFQQFLNKYRVKVKSGLVYIDYKNITQTDITALNDYIDKLTQINLKEYNRNEQLAYWINLYNALIIRIIFDHYPVDNIKEINISPTLFSTGPFDTNLIKIGHHHLSLRDIINRILRPIWNDPRILYALYDGSIGGPTLFHKVFDARTLETSLNQVSFAYINSLRAVQIFDKQLVVSRIYDWYEEDFGGSKQAVIEHIKQFALPPLDKNLANIKTISGYIYNWHLNALHKNP